MGGGWVGGWEEKAYLERPRLERRKGKGKG